MPQGRVGGSPGAPWGATGGYRGRELHFGLALSKRRRPLFRDLAFPPSDRSVSQPVAFLGRLDRLAGFANPSSNKVLIGLGQVIPHSNYHHATFDPSRPRMARPSFAIDLENLSSLASRSSIVSSILRAASF